MITIIINIVMEMQSINIELATIPIIDCIKTKNSDTIVRTQLCFIFTYFLLSIILIITTVRYEMTLAINAPYTPIIGISVMHNPIFITAPMTVEIISILLFFAAVYIPPKKIE